MTTSGAPTSPTEPNSDPAQIASNLAHAKAAALATLLDLAQLAKSEETRRKACMDLLTLEPPDHREPSAVPDPVDDADDASLRTLLSQLGAMTAPPHHAAGAGS